MHLEEKLFPWVAFPAAEVRHVGGDVHQATFYTSTGDKSAKAPIIAIYFTSIILKKMSESQTKAGNQKKFENLKT